MTNYVLASISFIRRLSYLIKLMCHLVWHFCQASDTRRLRRIQEKGLRAAFNDRNSSYQALLDRANLPTLRNTRRL